MATGSLSIAMVGTRGVPASYGGFETAVEEVGKRLVGRGHEVTVYSRGQKHPEPEYLGMRLVHLPAVAQKQLDTPSHTALSALHLITRRTPDVAFVFNAANSPFLPAFRLRGVPVALHMDGLEWRRAKWGGMGKAYYRRAEEFGVRTGDALIADAPGIADYYRDQFSVDTELIRYGAPLLEGTPSTRLGEVGVAKGQYHLVVARFEPENHVLEIVEGYRRSEAKVPLLLVGSAPYGAAYLEAIRSAAGGDPRIRLVGGIYDQELLDALYANAYTYIHGHSVGGTNPSLLRAIGAATPVVAFDVGFNREVIEDDGWFFRTPEELAAQLPGIEADPHSAAQRGARNRERAEYRFNWEDVASDYEDLARRLAGGWSVHPDARRARRRAGSWSA